MKESQRAAREAIEAAMRVAVSLGISRRSVLLGLWQTAISTILEVADPGAAVEVLVDRAAAIKGQGANADAPALRLDPETARKRRDESSKAAGVISGHLESLRKRLVAEGLEDDLPEIVLDTAIVYLTDAWGPFHLRKALSAQVDATGEGLAGPIFPPEPSAWNAQGRPPVPGRAARQTMPPADEVAPGRPARGVPDEATVPERRPVRADEPQPESPTGDDREAPSMVMVEEAAPIDLDDMVEVPTDGFTMDDDGYDAVRPDEEEDGPEPSVEHPNGGAEAGERDDLGAFAEALDSLDGELPIPDVGRARPKGPREEAETDHGRHREPGMAHGAEAPPETASVDAGRFESTDGVTADDLLAMLDVPAPDDESSEEVAFDEMPVPVAPAHVPVVESAWHRSARVEEGIAVGTFPTEPVDEGDEGRSGGGPPHVADVEVEDDEVEDDEEHEDSPSAPPCLDPFPETAETVGGIPAAGGARDALAFQARLVDSPPRTGHEDVAAVPSPPVERPAPAREAQVERPAPASEAQVDVAPPTFAEPIPSVPVPVRPRPERDEAVDAVPSRSFASVSRRLLARGRWTECMIVVEGEDGGRTSAYACVADVNCDDGSSTERREVVGTVPGVGRRASLAACARVLAAMGEPGHDERMRVVVDAEALLSGMAPSALRPSRSRPDSEADLWEDLDVLCAGRTMQWVMRKPGIGAALAERCERLLHHRLASRT